MATLKEVAEYAGVSPAIVSRILNRKEGVWASEETRKRILEAATALRYRPSASARALSTGRTFQLAVSTASADLQLGRPAQLWQLLGMTDAAARHGYHLILMASQGVRPEPAEFDALIRSNACDGFVLFAEQLTPEIRETLQAANIPFVVVGDPGDETVPQVDIDNYQYAYDSVVWLHKQGHRRIGLAEFADVRAGTALPHIQKIRAGYAQAMADLECGLDPAWAPTKRSETSAERLAWVTGPDAPTALILPSAQDGFLWEATLRGNGISVPNDVALLCHIATMETMYIEPGIAYHTHDLRAMGDHAGQMLIDWIEAGKVPERKVLIRGTEPAWKLSSAEVEAIDTNGGTHERTQP